MSSGSATEIVSRLRRSELIDEIPAPRATRGRPTRILSPHPHGPVVLAIEIRQNGSRSAWAGLDGELHPLHDEPATEQVPERVIARVGMIVRHARRRFQTRLCAISVAIAGTVQAGFVVYSAALGWTAVDLAGIPGLHGLPLQAGNDATLAGIAEARHGAASGARVSLHLSVQVGIGGILVIDETPVEGASGAAGEFGHMPFGDPAAVCPCGATACWELEVDGRALARLLGEPAPNDAYRYGTEVIAAASTDVRARAAAAHVASALGRGTSGLVNAHDPEIVTLGGLGPLLVSAAQSSFDDSYLQGLMSFHRRRPPPVVAAIHPEDGALRGALEMALDFILTESGVAAWSAKQAWRTV